MAIPGACVNRSLGSISCGDKYYPRGLFYYFWLLYNVNMVQADLDKLVTSESALPPIGGAADFFQTLTRKMRSKSQEPAVPAANWQDGHSEGQLAVDVAQTDKAIIITSTVAGARPEDLSININNDLLTIRGRREREVEVKEEDYFYKECYWGSFSRTIVLPVDVLTDQAEATFKNGVLTIVLPKESSKKEVKIKVVEE